MVKRFNCSALCVVNNHPEELLRVLDEEGHAAVQLLQIVFQVSGRHLERERGAKTTPSL